MFKCKVCIEKSARIADLEARLKDAAVQTGLSLSELKAQYEARIGTLEDHIAGLKRLAFPPSTPYRVDPTALEADAALSGAQEVLNYEEDALSPEVEAEASRILSGNY